MDFGLFGIGLDRILLIMIVAIIVFGPDKLPGMARQAGKWVNELRRLTQEARGEIQNLTKELDMEELNKVKADLADLRKDLAGTGKDLLGNFQDIKKEISLTDALGNQVAVQHEQYTYQVEKLPEGETGAIVVEETIKRETVIQDLVNAGEPVSATETYSATTNTQSNSDSEAGLAVIRPATPVPVMNLAEVTTHLSPALNMNSPEITTDLSPVPVMNLAEVTTEPSPVVTNGLYHGPEVVDGVDDSSKLLAFDSGPSAEQLQRRADDQRESALRHEMLDLEGTLQTNRQEMYERLEDLERRFLARLERLEQALGQTAGSGQG